MKLQPAPERRLTTESCRRAGPCWVRPASGTVGPRWARAVTVGESGSHVTGHPPLRPRAAKHQGTGSNPQRAGISRRRRRPRRLRRCRAPPSAAVAPNEVQPLPTRMPEVPGSVSAASRLRAARTGDGPDCPPIEHEGEDGGAGDGHKGDGKRHDVHRIARLELCRSSPQRARVKGLSAIPRPAPSTGWQLPQPPPGAPRLSDGPCRDPRNLKVPSLAPSIAVGGR